jgi:hypothetical protein
MNAVSPTARAFIVVMTCGAATALQLPRIENWSIATPLLLFYVLLLIHTFFSIRCFSAVIPASPTSQRVIDTILLILYLALTFLFEYAFAFTATLIIFFALSTLKYHLAPPSPHHAHILRKARINALALMPIAAVALGAYAGYSPAALWGGLAIYLAVSVYLFWIRPLYHASDTIS